MNRLVSTRSVLALRPLLVAPRRNITYAHTSYQTTTLDEHGLPQTETVEIFATSETNKVGIVTQKEYYDEEGNYHKKTIPPKKWDKDLASTSEEIVKAERHADKYSSVADMQAKSLKGLQELEDKMSKARTKLEQ